MISMNHPRTLTVVIGCVLLSALAGCGNDSMTSPTEPSAPAVPAAPTTPMAPAAPAAPAQTRIIGLSGDLSFGNVQIGSKTTATLTISNTGNAAVTVIGIAASGSVTGVFVGSWLSGTIAAGGSQQVTIQFAPTAPQIYSGTLTVNSDATSGTNTIGVSGTGTAVAVQTRIIGLSGNLSFGSVPVGSTATATLTISNTGNAPLTVSGIAASGSMSSVLLGSWLSGTIAAGGSQQVTMQLAPTAAQAYTGTLMVNSDATSGTNTISVSGTGTTVTKVTTPGYYVWGGPNYTQYLGVATCVFCVEYDSNSINNQFGSYGSQFSTTSIRNQFSQYGSEFSTYSACNQFASNPPRVYNADRSVYYGELTLNQFRVDSIKASDIVSWLTTNVCKH